MNTFDFRNSYLQPQTQLYVVSSMQEAQNIQVQFNTIYVALNRQAKEVYIKQLNNDGLINFEVYSMKKDEPEKDYSKDLTEIKNKLSNLESVFFTQQKGGTKNEQSNK